MVGAHDRPLLQPAHLLKLGEWMSVNSFLGWVHAGDGQGERHPLPFSCGFQVMFAQNSRDLHDLLRKVVHLE